MGKVEKRVGLECIKEFSFCEKCGDKKAPANRCITFVAGLEPAHPRDNSLANYRVYQFRHTLI